MGGKIDLVLCGADEKSVGDPYQSDVVTGVRAESIDLANCGSDQLNGVLRGLRAEHVAFTDCRREFSFDVLPTVPQQMADAAAEIGLVLSPQSSRFSKIWNQLPANVACRVRAPDDLGVLIVARSLLEKSEFLNVHAPLWDWLIRTVEANRRVLVIDHALGNSAGAEFDQLPELAPNCPSPKFRWLRSHLESFSANDAGPSRVSATDETALKAGLLLIHDYLDDSHAMSQSIEGDGPNRAGDYWHAIMHRREPDYSNSKYWFRRVGRHPVFEPLATAANTILAECNSPDSATWRQRMQSSDGWDAFAFVDLCQSCERTDDASLAQAARRIQYEEMLLLLEQTWQDALR